MSRYYNMTMTELVNLKKRKEKEIDKLLRKGLYNDRLRAVKLKEHLVLINAEIASRVMQIPLFGDNNV